MREVLIPPAAASMHPALVQCLAAALRAGLDGNTSGHAEALDALNAAARMADTPANRLAAQLAAGTLRLLPQPRSLTERTSEP